MPYIIRLDCTLAKRFRLVVVSTIKSYKYMLASIVRQKYNNELEYIIYVKMNRRGRVGASIERYQKAQALFNLSSMNKWLWIVIWRYHKTSYFTMVVEMEKYTFLKWYVNIQLFFRDQLIFKRQYRWIVWASHYCNFHKIYLRNQVIGCIYSNENEDIHGSVHRQKLHFTMKFM